MSKTNILYFSLYYKTIGFDFICIHNASNISTIYKLTIPNYPKWTKASLIQLYTGMVYRGPGIAKKISEDLNNIFKKQGVTNISEIVGSKK